MNRDDVNWQGCMLAVITPFNKDESIDEKAFSESLENEIKSGVKGVIISANTGESWSLDEAEKRRLYELAVKQVEGRVPVIAGTDAMLVKETIRLAKHAAELKMDGVLVMPPTTALPKPNEVVAFYNSVSHAASIPITIHNDPGRVVVNISPDTVNEIAEVDNVVAIKEGCPDVMQELETLRLTRDRIRVMCGWPVRRALWSFAMGADGSVGGADVVLGGEAYQLWDLVQAGELEKARQIQARMHILIKGLAGAGTFHSALKEALRLLGRPAGHVRRPFLPLNESGRQKVRETLSELGLL